MELLIAILLKMGFYYNPTQLFGSSQNEEVITAQHIIDTHSYHYDEDGGVVIEDDVDPIN